MKERGDKWHNLTCPHCKNFFSLGVRTPEGRDNMKHPAHIIIHEDDALVDKWVTHGKIGKTITHSQKTN